VVSLGFGVVVIVFVLVIVFVHRYQEIVGDVTIRDD
jgi:hypothetical protein